MTDVFISYARTDRNRIEKLANSLIQRGYDVWWDHNIAGGVAFAAEIEAALRQAKCVVVAWSVKAIQSEWVIDEAGVGKQGGKLIPISLDATPPPIGFRQLQSIDFVSWPGDGDLEDEAFLRLCQSIDRYQGRGSGPMTKNLIEERINSGYADAIAVLPLENLTGKADQQYFVDGMHEALIIELSKIDKLKVISRSSAKRFAGSNLSIREIAAELGVSKVVEGSVMRAGNSLRISVELVDARTDTHLWADSFHREEEDVMKLQQEVTREIAQRTDAALSSEDKNRLSTGGNVNTLAYKAYLRGMYHWYKLSPEDTQAALACFEEALAIDPEYALAYTGIAYVWAGIQQMGVMPSTVVAPKIREAVERALELDSGLFQAHTARATYMTWSEWNWEAAELAFQKAIELNPNFPDSHAFYSHFLMIVGRFDESRLAIQKALELDPFNPLIRSLYGVDLIAWGQFDDAIQQLEEVKNMMPGHWLPLQALRMAYWNKGMTVETFQVTRELYRLLEQFDVVSAMDAALESGATSIALHAGADSLAQVSDRSHTMAAQVAMLYNVSGDMENTAKWVERAFQYRDPELPYLKHLYLISDESKSHPRISKVISDLNFPSHS